MSDAEKGPALKDIDWEAEADKASREYLRERQKDRANQYRLEEPAANLAGIRQHLEPLDYHPNMSTPQKAALISEVGADEYRRQRKEYARRNR